SKLMCHRTQTPALLAGKAERLIDDHARHRLPIALAHQTRFVCVDGEALLPDDSTCEGAELVGGIAIHIARKGKIVGVTRVNQSALSCQTRQPMVEAEQ